MAVHISRQCNRAITMSWAYACATYQTRDTLLERCKGHKSRGSTTRKHNHMQTTTRSRARRESASEKGTCNALFHKLQLLQDGGFRGEGTPQAPTLPRLQTQRSMDGSMLLRQNKPAAQTDAPKRQTICHDFSKSAQREVCWSTSSARQG